MDVSMKKKKKKKEKKKEKKKKKQGLVCTSTVSTIPGGVVSAFLPSQPDRDHGIR